MQLEPCNRRAFCNCGVAVRMGQDVYAISLCGKLWSFEYKVCGDKVLRVQSFRSKLYKVMFWFVYLVCMHGVVFHFSSPEQRSGRAIILPPALASTNFIS